MPPATHTARDLITAALKRLGVLSGIETPAADLAVDGLDRLNSLIETWSTEALTTWAIRPQALPFVSARNPYRLGDAPGTDLSLRPSEIDGVALLLAGTPNYEYPLQRLDSDHWEAEHVKALTAPQATWFYYQPDYPIGLLYLWPVCIGGGGAVLNVIVYLRTPLLAYDTLDTLISLPPGYYRALRDWLAIELAPEVGRTPPPTLIASAQDALAQLKRTNTRHHVLQMPPLLPGLARGGYDWRTDE